jgi:hypothetical protein
MFPARALETARETRALPLIQRISRRDVVAKNSRQFAKLTRSRPLARPYQAFGFTEFLSPLPQRLKSRMNHFFP